MNRTFLVWVLLSLACQGLAQAAASTPDFSQGEFKDTAQNHWAYEGVAYLKSQGWLVGYPDGLGHRPQYISRYEFGVIFHAASLNIQNSVDGTGDLMKLLAKQVFQNPGGQKMTQELKEHLGRFSDPLFKKAIAYLARGTWEFEPELVKLGVRPKETFTTVLACMADLSRLHMVRAGSAYQFRDVPAGHWAAKDVLELRKLGLLDGYEERHSPAHFSGLDE